MNSNLKTLGLCGNSNGEASDDYTMRNRVKSVDMAHFVESWVHKGSFFGQLNMHNPSKQCSINHFRLCEQLLQDPFKSCHALLDPSIYITRCQTDICNCYGDRACSFVFCSAAATYAADCVTALEVHDDKVANWRVEIDFCAETCPKNEVWSTTTCALSETCQSLSVSASCSEPLEGCKCKKGFYRSTSGKCVPQTSCGCYDETGLVLAAGESRFENGRICRCQSGRIRCQESREIQTTGAPLSRRQRNKMGDDYVDDECIGDRSHMPENEAKVCGQIPEIDSADEVCGCKVGWWDNVRKECIESDAHCSCEEMYKPRTTLCSDFKCKNGKWVEKKKACPSECSIFGTEHVVSFDGKNYNFNSNCEVIVATNNCDKRKQGEDYFRITVKNELCQNSPNLVCTKKLSGGVYNLNLPCDRLLPKKCLVSVC